jgi:hypothetical protein
MAMFSPGLMIIGHSRDAFVRERTGFRESRAA